MSISKKDLGPWILVTKDNLPPEGEEVLVVIRPPIGARYRCDGVRQGRKWYSWDYEWIHNEHGIVTHYCRLPEIPE